MADDNDVEDALDMSLKVGENEEIVRRVGRNGGKIPLAKIERRSLDESRESEAQRG